jgi:hypothetical protein
MTVCGFSSQVPCADTPRVKWNLDVGTSVTQGTSSAPEHQSYKRPTVFCLHMSPISNGVFLAVAALQN